LSVDIGVLMLFCFGVDKQVITSCSYLVVSREKFVLVWSEA